MSRLDQLTDALLATEAGAFVSSGSDPEGGFRDLPSPLPPVPAFDLDLVPAPLRSWVADTADGLQVPAEFVAVPAIVAAAGLIGRQVGVALKTRERWVEPSILWGCIVGRPSSGKSPALRPAQRMLSRIEADHRKEWEVACRTAEVDAELAEQERAQAKKAAAKLLREGNREGAREALAVEDPDPSPAEPRIVVNDATVEKLGELLNTNPRGLVQFRDELAGWLASLDREGREGDRGFWLECWNGRGPYTCDRIGRGTIRVEAPAVSILGGVQPGKLADYVRSAIRGGMGDDGLVQRFQLAVWPDLPASWHYVDRAPDPAAEAAAWRIYQRLDRCQPEGLETVDGIDLPFLRLGDVAQELHVEFTTALMQRLRAGGEPPWMESHLAKYPALAGRLALVLHLIENEAGPVGDVAMASALDWCEFLEAHARRIYAPACDNGLSAAHLLVKRRQELPGQFTTRDVYRRGWAGLDREAVEGAVEVLVEHGHLAEQLIDTGGRPTAIYTWRVPA